MIKISSFTKNLKYKRIFNKIFKIVLDELNQNDIFIVEVNFIKKEEIKNLNKNTRNIDKETDVLSFPFLEINDFKDIKNKMYLFTEEGKVFLGETDICFQVAKEQSKEYGHSLKREICFLFTHSILHLFGYDHIKEDERKIMRSLEEKILNKLNIKRG